MTYFITGIGGFAGSHLAEHLLSDPEARVAGLLAPGESDVNLRTVAGRLTLLRGDITDAEAVRSAILELRPDAVIHLAAQSSVRNSLDNPLPTFTINVTGATNLLEAVRTSGTSPRVLIITSGEIYGDSEGNPLPTETTKPAPVNPYAASKTAIDYIAQTYRSFHGLDVVVVRPFNHTGPRQKPIFVCSSFARQLARITRRGLPPELHVGNLAPRRDFTDVRDVVRAYGLLAKADLKGHGIVNVASGAIVTIGDILAMLGEISGVAVRRETDPDRLRRRDVMLVAGNASLLRKTTGWTPTIPLRQSLADLYQYWLDAPDEELDR